MKYKQKVTSVILCAAIAGVSLFGCGKQEAQEAARDVAAVYASNPEVGDLTLSNSFIATINPDESVYVIPKATAEVLAVNVKAGDAVKEGDALAVLDDTMAQIQLNSARLQRDSAQIQHDNAQHAYNLSYGDAAGLINDMQADSNLDNAADGVETLQKSLVEAMDSLKYYKDKLADKEKELADLKNKYNYTNNVKEIRDYAKTFDKNNPMEARDYANAMERYQEAATDVGKVEAEITAYKQTIDQLETTIDELQTKIGSTYNQYSQAVTSSDLSNGEMREEQKQVSQNSISATKLGVEQAQLGIKQAQESLDAYTITAAISGVIEAVNVKEHDFASPSSPAFVIANKDAMTATFYVSEDVRNTFRISQSVSLEKDGKNYTGKIIEIASAVDQATGLFKVKAGVSGDTKALLSGTKATLTTDTYRENNAVIVPYDTVYYDGTDAYVYTVVDGKAKKTSVTTGLYDEERIVITEGLSAADLLITTWSAQLRDGVEVSIISAESTSAGAAVRE